MMSGPIVREQGWTPGPVSSYETGLHAWLLWPGVTMMVMDAMTNLTFLINWTKVYQLLSGLIMRRFVAFVVGHTMLMLADKDTQRSLLPMKSQVHFRSTPVHTGLRARLCF
jgi:hypothetical protein